MSVLIQRVFLLCCLLCTAAWAGSAIPASAEHFLPEQQVLPTLDALQQKAAAEQKLLLLVLGADWCHDSVSLLQHFNQPDFAAALSQRFERAFIDVRFLQFGQAITQRYQLPLYYGTPTVLIIAPDSGQLLNKTDLMHWTNAASFDEKAYQQYFIATDFKQQFAKEQQQLAGVSTALLQQIAEFEQQQAAKLQQAYGYLGPLLQAYKKSGKPAGAEFNQAWSEVKSFRSQILPDVEKLQQQAKRLAAGESLLLPEYGVFSFSKELVSESY